MRRLARRVRSLLLPPPVVLCYHRVASPAADPWGISVTPENFASQMAMLAARRRPMAADDFVAGWISRSLPRGAIAITFDDGYADTLAAAKPVLERHGVPATVFLATGSIGEDAFWWDELAALVALSRPTVPVTLEAGTLAIEVPAADERWDAAWRTWEPPATPRQAALVAAWEALRALGHDDRGAILRRWRAALGASAPSAEGRPMTEGEIATLTGGGLVQIAAHTVSHPPLSRLTPEAALREMIESKARCDALAGAPTRGFAYPFGDRDAAVDALATQAGFGWAMALGVSAGATRSPWAVPRRIAPDVDGATLLAQLGA